MNTATNELITEFVAQGGAFRDWRPRFSIAPTDVVPVVRERADEQGELMRMLEPAVWDFWPMWQDASKKKRPQFNSRIETLATNGLWKKSFFERRCIVPMTGYFEWTERAGARYPHFIHGDQTLAAAGIYAPRRVEDSDEWVLTVSIVTREARDASGELHERMPVFLVPDVFDEWLSPVKLGDTGQVEETLTTLDQVSGTVAATLTSYSVNRRINNSRTIDPFDPHLLDPVEEPPSVSRVSNAEPGHAS